MKLGEKLRKLDLNKRPNSKKSRLDFRNWLWRLPEMPQESKKNRKKLRSKRDLDKSGWLKMKLREESESKMKRMSGKD